MRKIKTGFTLIEILIVVAILAVLLVVGFASYLKYIPKAQDARRKADLVKIKQVMQDYYNDHGEFPPTYVLRSFCEDHTNTELSAYISRVPCDPATKKAYIYLTYPNSETRTKGFRVLAQLNNLDDPAIGLVNCDPGLGCGVGQGFEDYVYGVSEGVPVSTLGNPDQPDSTWWCSPINSFKCKDWDGTSACTGILYQTQELCIADGNGL